MKKRFVVIIESSTKEQNDSFLDWVKQENLGWWHWFQNAWLISNTTGTHTASSIRDKVNEFFPTKNTLVIGLKEGEGSWSGYGPNSEKRSMFKWLKTNWRKGPDL